MLNSRIVKALTLFVVIIPRAALCDRSLVDSTNDSDAGIRKGLEEVEVGKVIVSTAGRFSR